MYFQVHQPTRLRLYRFFDMGKDSHYYDDFANRTILRRVAQKCYLPMNALLLEQIRLSGGKFRVAFSLSGSVLEQFERYAPEVIDSFRALAETGCVEFLGETYYHSLASMASPSEFLHQVVKHRRQVEELFGVTPTVFRNTELIYSNAIGEQVYALGYKTMLTEGARHIMGWRSPNFVYSSETCPKLRLLLRNYTLSDDIAFRFSDRGWGDWPLTADKFLGWMKESAATDDIINLFMDYETFGEHQDAASGIFDFMRALPGTVIGDGTFELLQQDAYNKLYGLQEKLSILNDAALWNDYGHLQESDHLYYMCTKFFSDGEVHKYFNPYDTPYEAFINYMNVLSDFQIRLDEASAALDVRETAEKEEAAPVEKAPVKKRAVRKKAAK